MTFSNHTIARIVISGLRGGGGKTILSLCLIALLKKKGIEIIPFKKGPDYIDAGWLAKAAGTPCYNLDLFMMSQQQILQSFMFHTCNYQIPMKPKIRNPKFEIKSLSSNHIALIEGNRGLYDGVDYKGTYSTAELAKLLKSPVLLIIDCTKSTNTIAAMVLGCQRMDRGVFIKGVVLNHVATSRQESVIRKAINETCKLPVLGAIPRLKKDPFPERHMGLIPFQEHAEADKSISVITELGEKYLDMDGILRIAKEAEPLEAVISNKLQVISEDKNASLHQPIAPSPKIGIIKDSAFQFYYQENLEELKKRGARLIEVSPLNNSSLPVIDALYIGGGFPETHAIALAENISFKDSLREAVEKGLPVYAECGGLMYLGKSLILNNKTYPMAGILPIVFGIDKKPQAHGYTIIEIEKANPYFPKGITLKGHEFHYSRVIEVSPFNSPHDNEGYRGDYFAFKMKRGKGIRDGMDGLCYKNVLATYTHLHAIGAPEWADGLISCALRRKSQA